MYIFLSVLIIFIFVILIPILIGKFCAGILQSFPQKKYLMILVLFAIVLYAFTIPNYVVNKFLPQILHTQMFSEKEN
jgi:hypothetical protein